MDWTRLLSEHQVDYRSAGAHNLEVHCPWCGDADPSMHLAISIRGRGYRCFRNDRHSGKNSARLIQALLRCTWEQACAYAGYNSVPSVADEDVGTELAAMLGMGPKKPAHSGRLDLLREFKTLSTTSVLAEPFLNYLYDRGLSNYEISWAIKAYQLCYCTRGPWQGRIIIPIHDERGRVMTWTARTIQSEASIRYKTLASDPDEGPGALDAPGRLLLGLPLLWEVTNPKILVICEGPFDAIRISCAGHQRGVYGTCLFGLNISAAQVEHLEQLTARFSRMRLLLDDDAQLILLSVMERLAALPVQAARLPEGVKDPGALPAAAAEALVGNLLAA